MPSHDCRGIVVTCMDWRLHPALTEALKDEAGGDLDHVVVAGGVKPIVRPPADAVPGFLLEQIDISVRLHHIDEILLVGHTDCGAYGGTPSFESPAHERETIVGDLRKAQAIVRERFPAQKVRCLLAVVEAVGDAWKIRVEPLD